MARRAPALGLALSGALAGCLDVPRATDAGAGGASDGAPAIYPPVGVELEITAAAAADLDGDGRDELVLASGHPDSAGVYVLWSDGVGVSFLETDLLPTTIAVGDLGGSPWVDLVVGGFSEGATVVAFLNDGRRGFAAVAVDLGWSAVPSELAVVLDGAPAVPRIVGLAAEDLFVAGIDGAEVERVALDFVMPRRLMPWSAAGALEGVVIVGFGGKTWRPREAGPDGPGFAAGGTVQNPPLENGCLTASIGPDLGPHLLSIDGDGQIFYNRVYTGGGTVFNTSGRFDAVGAAEAVAFVDGGQAGTGTAVVALHADTGLTFVRDVEIAGGSLVAQDDPVTIALDLDASQAHLVVAHRDDDAAEEVVVVARGGAHVTVD